MQEYRVELEAYAGPLDLLLYLVKRHEIDLYDIPIAQLTEQYLHHIELIKHIDINLAGEFLVMASTLLEIKSAMLMPPQSSQGESENQTDTDGISSLDPRYELVQQLLEYKRFKDAANELESRREVWEARFPHLPYRPKPGQAASDDDAENAPPIELDLEDASIMDLCEAFARILASVGSGPARHEVVYDDTPIALHAEDILDRLKREGATSLQRMFEGRTRRSELIGLFLATLELVRQRKVKVIQEDRGEVRLEARTPEEAAQPDDKPRDWRNPETGEIEYEWPSEQDRKRAERRAKLRATFAAKRKAGEAVDEESALDDELENEDSNDESDSADTGAGADDENTTQVPAAPDQPHPA